jgi:peptide deformylase
MHLTDGHRAMINELRVVTYDHPALLQTTRLLRTTPYLEGDLQELLHLLASRMQQLCKQCGLVAMAMPQLGLGLAALATSAGQLFVNPSLAGSGELVSEIEGCGSIPGLHISVPRYPVVRYETFTLEGTAISGEANGFAARMLQHECDHLRGKLIVPPTLLGSGLLAVVARHLSYVPTETCRLYATPEDTQYLALVAEFDQELLRAYGSDKDYV